MKEREANLIIVEPKDGLMLLVKRNILLQSSIKTGCVGSTIICGSLIFFFSVVLEFNHEGGKNWINT